MLLIFVEIFKKCRFSGFRVEGGSRAGRGRVEGGSRAGRGAGFGAFFNDFHVFLLFS